MQCIVVKSDEFENSLPLIMLLLAPYGRSAAIRDWMSGCPHLLEDLNLPLLSLSRFPFFVLPPLPNNPPAPFPHYLNVKNRQISVKSSLLSKRFRAVSEQRTRTTSRNESQRFHEKWRE